MLYAIIMQALPLYDVPIIIFAIVLIISLVIPELLKEIRMIVVPFYIIGGIVLGPHGLGFETNDALIFVGDIGILFLVFIAGLEIREYGRIEWKKPVLGRYILVFNRDTGKTGQFAWSKTEVTVNDGKPLKLRKPFCEGEVMLIDLGAKTKIESLQLEITAPPYSGISVIEIHEDRKK